MAGNHATQATSASRPVVSARYNQLVASERFDDAAWTKSNATITANAATAPDGTATADKLVANATNTDHLVSASAGSVSGATSYTITLHIKAAEYSWVRLSFGGTPGGGYAFFNAATGAVGTVSTGAGESTSVLNVGNGWYRVSFSRLSGASGTLFADVYLQSADNQFGWAGNGTSGILVWGADLRATNDGAGLPVYQRVNTASDYDVAGFPAYLRFDGVDDWLQTGNVNFSGTDKMLVVTGARKLSDAAYSVIAEISTTPDTTAGTFGIGSGTLIGDASRRTWGVVLNGTARVIGGASLYPQPDTRVLAAQYDTAPAAAVDELRLRLNGSPIALTFDAATAGTGNFGNYPLYVGRRGGTTLPFNGRVYGLIVRGAQSSTQQVEQAERYVNGKTKAY